MPLADKKRPKPLVQKKFSSYLKKGPYRPMTKLAKSALFRYNNNWHFNDVISIYQRHFSRWPLDGSLSTVLTLKIGRKSSTYLFWEDGDVLVERLWGTHIATRDPRLSWRTRGQLALFEYERQKGEQRVSATEKRKRRQTSAVFATVMKVHVVWSTAISGIPWPVNYPDMARRK